jgi:hypothetical protein
MVLPFTNGDWTDDTDGPAVGVEQPEMNKTRHDDAMKVWIVGRGSWALMGTSSLHGEVRGSRACRAS